LAARAQQGESIRQVGILVNQVEDDPEIQAALAGFRLEPSPDGHLLIVGSNHEARADAIERVTQFLAKQLP
jgi:hypothetical protein